MREGGGKRGRGKGERRGAEEKNGKRRIKRGGNGRGKGVKREIREIKKGRVIERRRRRIKKRIKRPNKTKPR